MTGERASGRGAAYDWASGDAQPVRDVLRTDRTGLDGAVVSTPVVVGGGRRGRIVGALVAVAAERGFYSTTVRLVCERAGVSTRTFYEEFDDLRECFVVALDLGLEWAWDVIERAFARRECWQDGILDALASLLVFFDSEPQLTRVWFVEVLAAGSWALERREQHVARVRSMIVTYWSGGPVAAGPEPRIAAGVMASILGLIHTYLLTREPGSLIELLGPLVSLTTAPYLDLAGMQAQVARAEQLAHVIKTGEEHPWAPAIAFRDDTSRGGPREDEHAAAETLPASLVHPRARRLRECLLYVAEHPGASNGEIAVAIAIKHESLISRLLARLLKERLVGKHPAGRVGGTNAWYLTRKGQAAVRALSER
jgi:AcrR family transcriptional regulator